MYKNNLEIFSWNIAWRKHRTKILFAALFCNPMNQVKNNVLTKEAFSPCIYHLAAYVFV